MAKMKVYKRLKKAQEVANGSPVVQCGEFFIVGMAPFSEARIIDAEGYVRGNVTMSALEKLGNANWAEPDPDHAGDGQIFSFIKNFDRAGGWIGNDNPSEVGRQDWPPEFPDGEFPDSRKYTDPDWGNY